MQLIATLFDGPIDIVGDVHGEIEALRNLMQQLGYSEHGEHPHHRRLVFLGDLCDRGPDSPAVIRLVQHLVDSGHAQCLLGNHEINILRAAAKNGNGWFFAHDHDRAQQRFTQCMRVNDAERTSITAFLATLPLTLQRDDLRLVHAAWIPRDVAAIDAAPECSALDLYRHYETLTEAQVAQQGMKAAVDAELHQYAGQLFDATTYMPLLPALGLYDETYQMSNPVRVLTSGVERRVTTPFFASGKWRMVERVPWWDDYHDATPVIIGHYWRWFDEHTRSLISKGEADLFDTVAANDWQGACHNVYCVDFSVGGRYKERELGRTRPWGTRLAAVRWPEREVVFDDGLHLPLLKEG